MYYIEQFVRNLTIGAFKQSIQIPQQVDSYKAFITLMKESENKFKEQWNI